MGKGRGEAFTAHRSPLYNRSVKRTDLMDTSVEVHREIVRRLRAMTPDERARRLLESIRFSLALEDRARSQGFKRHEDYR